MILPDHTHSITEQRLRAIGRTAAGRYVFVVFTIRDRDDRKCIRPISARHMRQKEVDSYEKENPDI
jgi:uncharacterized DUF497 family protein